MPVLRRYATVLILMMTCMLMFGGCAADDGTDELTISAEADKESEQEAEVTPEPTQEPEETEEIEETDEDDYTDGLGDTFIGDTEESEVIENKDVDLIFFMGQSNMSGAAGDASLAPHVSEDAGMEFRAVSDPTKLYPLTEPFGINENNPTGLTEYPGAKKGSLVSAFVNEYHELTGRRVVAVSVSMGATDMETWMTPGVIADVGGRYDSAVSFLNNNGYTIGHIYAVWLHGESDAIKGTDPEVYRTDLDNIMRPLFIKGLQKVFIIAPGRTIDYKDIFLDIINMQKKICAESGYYAMATTVLTKVSTEYMTDMYHYNQHVLNMVGIEAAKAAAYYTEHREEKIVYDYREGKDIVPDGVDPDSQEKEDHIHLSEININEVY
ncbi:MAG: sialate O-acetylesterase [Lachnospiraceae bacterium]|nr:sialate O-acetylesterase [Lachnospiraceae bacterium]